MNSDITLDQFLKKIETSLKITSISEKDHIILIFLVLLSIFLIKWFFNFLNSQKVKRNLKSFGFLVLDKVFSISNKLNSELPKLRQKIHEIKDPNVKEIYENLPKLTDDQIKLRLKHLNDVDRIREKSGKECQNYYFSTQEDQREFVSEMSKDFLYTNVMFFDSSKGSLLLENELISFFKNLLHGDKQVVGSTTSGGTESLFLAVLTMREFGRKKGIENPEILAFESIHVAVNKAAFYLNVHLRLIPYDSKTGEGKIDDLLDQINQNTAGIILSGGNYATGLIDPIPEIATAIKGMNILLHVDSCLGGFMTCMSRVKKDNRYPPIDFTLPEVTSISIDPHKHGESPKGCSVILFRNENIKMMSTFLYPKWNGGFYFSQTFPGSKGCAPFVGAWVSMVRYGIPGLLQIYDIINSSREMLLKDIKSFKELEIYGNPNTCVVAFLVKKNQPFNVFDLHEALTQTGWKTAVNQNPYSIHLTLTKHTAEKIPNFKDDLGKAIQKCRQEKNLGKENVFGGIYIGMKTIPNDEVSLNFFKLFFMESNRLKPV